MAFDRCAIKDYLLTYQQLSRGCGSRKII